MSKAILVIDMPKCCDECFALDDGGDYPFCRITQEQRGYTFRTREQKMDKCPLEPMFGMRKIDFEHDNAVTAGIKHGWNECVTNLLGI